MNYLELIEAVGGQKGTCDLNRVLYSRASESIDVCLCKHLKGSESEELILSPQLEYKGLTDSTREG